MAKFILIIAAAIGAGAVLLGLRSLNAPSAKAEKNIQVICFWDTNCPVCQRYAPGLRQLIDGYTVKGVDFQLKFPNEGENDATVFKYLNEFKLSAPWSFDPGAETAKNYKVEVAPSVVVLKDEKVIYRGALFDGTSPSEAKTKYLEDAINSALEGTEVAVKEAKPMGCYLQPSEAAPKMEEINYAEHIAPILNKHCISCHRPGQSAPFSLIGYENARAKANMMAFATSNGTMPPWRAVPGYGEFHGENRLTPVEKEVIDRWSKGGTMRGHLKDAPADPTFDSDWPIREPDMIVSPEKSFKVYADGPDIYRMFVIDPKLTETTYVSALAVRPGAPRVVHHVIAFLDRSDTAVAKAAANTDGQPGYESFGGLGFLPSGSLGGWAPGLQPVMLPDGTGIELHPGEKIVLQVHYHPTGKEEVDLTKVGLYIAKKKVTHPVDIAWLLDYRLKLPAGEQNISWTRKFPVQVDSTLYSVMPHMHLLGRAMKAWAVLPDGTEKPLIWVDNWDFNWQFQYSLKEPMKIPKGSWIYVSAVYDNSDKNMNNPNKPPKKVEWGEQTTDEMFLLVAALSPDDGKSRGTLFPLARPAEFKEETMVHGTIGGRAHEMDSE